MLRRIARRSCPLLPTGPEVQGVWQVDVCIGGTEEAGTASPPANTTHLKHVRLMLDQRRRQWVNIKPTLCQCLVFALVLFWSKLHLLILFSDPSEEYIYAQIKYHFTRWMPAFSYNHAKVGLYN